MNRGFPITARPARLIRSRRAILLRGLSALFWATTACTASAHDARQGELFIGHPWAKPADSGGTAEVYFAIVNRGAKADRLIGAETAVASHAVLAETVGDTATPRAAVDLLPKRPVPLRPGRLHVRLEGLMRPLREGDTFPLTLRFAMAPPVEVSVLVEAAPGH